MAERASSNGRVSAFSGMPVLASRAASRTGLWLIASRYFRADVDGLHHVSPEGPVLCRAGELLE